jgi:hypothetical protein
MCSDVQTHSDFGRLFDSCFAQGHCRPWLDPSNLAEYLLSHQVMLKLFDYNGCINFECCLFGWRLPYSDACCDNLTKHFLG